MKKELGIYWCARDLDTITTPLGNHQFVLFIVDESTEIFPDDSPLKETDKDGNDYYFYTASAGGEDSDPFDWNLLLMEINGKPDVQSVREGLNPEKYVKIYKADYDIENHKIIDFSEANFARIKSYLVNYSKNQKNKRVPNYDVTNLNCSSWVNTFFGALDVPYDTRRANWDFRGADLGEESNFDPMYFTKLL